MTGSLTWQNIPDKAALFRDLSATDITVPPANEQRNRAKEQHVLCKLLAGLAYNDLVRYPVSIDLHGTNRCPDCLLDFAGQSIGIEITQSGGTEFNNLLSDAENRFPDGYLIHTSPEHSEAVAIDAHDISGMGPPWAGDLPEQRLACEIEAAVKRKAGKFQGYGECATNWLAIYPLRAVPVGGPNSDATLLRLSGPKIASANAQEKFSSIFLIHKNIFCDTLDRNPKWMKIPDLWSENASDASIKELSGA